ncbi:autophagy related lipase-like protein Atg15 [Cucurbitaria berberidis CBS 394.84]|uniref:triacylglycerol lipase n=1 Tax=Cucurbitaria berberidis CBS 394.84 TaxID=1168544 RepID=A0A9P4GPB9_9PLEO|nr:autophagy related lipase-like protein Atg15 [Cucurbitaria berberidis CBS 394.84]KAF1848710.1 autophagy related lipase-like protein Atg15 [Cucurbitaria berberidis CBS 394.84]
MPSHAQMRSFWTTFSRVLFIIGTLAQVALLAVIFRSYAGDDVSGAATPVADAAPVAKSKSSGFTLRHLFHHGAGIPGPRARRLDVTPQRITAADAESQVGPFSVRLSPVKIERPAYRLYDAQSPMSPMWIAEDVEGPDVEEKETVINFAYMSEDAYKVGHDDPGWLDVDEQYNSSIPFGWDDSGIRGHVFSDDTNSTIILSVKGTTVAMFEGNGTSGNDKENDNLFGSCCCGQGGAYLWRQVCDCQTGTYTCDDKCVKDEIKKPNRYYAATVELYEEVIKLYPNANIITTGHSLGGVLASLIGLQHAVPSVTFETYPQALAAKRLGLPTAGDVAPLRKYTGGFHFGHTADPVYMGTCNGPSSFCTLGGYAFETLCHTGKRCAYDVVKDWGWRQSTSTHSLRYAIDKVYKVYDKAAKCEDEDVNCVDCFLWKYENGTHTKPTTTSTATSTTSSQTRTETCKTPGWWGCRDETATSTTSSTFSSTTTTSTCKTPGWFGCKDTTATTTITTTTSSTEPTTTTCTSKGWFGKCRDKVSVTTTPAVEGHAYWRTAPTATQTAP